MLCEVVAQEFAVKVLLCRSKHQPIERVIAVDGDGSGCKLARYRFAKLGVFHVLKESIAIKLWFFQPNAAIRGFGRLVLTSTTPEDNGTSNPQMYQTTINLAALGLANEEVLGFGFRDNSTNPRESTGIFAISGTAVPEPGSIAWLALGAGVLLFRRRSQV